MHALEKSLKLIKRIYSKRGCVLFSENSLEHQLGQLESEIEELRQAVAKNDVVNIEEELGDIISDALAVAVVAERRHHFKVQTVLRQLNKKILFRNPHVFGKNKSRNPEEARKILAKAKEDYKELLKKRSLKKKEK